LLAAAVMGAACTQPTTTRIEAICASPPAAAVVPVTIMVDTVESAAPLQLRQDLGKSYDLTLTLLPAESATPQACPDRSGIVTYADGIPTALANASAGSGNSVWRIDGANVVVDFAPSYRDNNFALSLPLAGGDGQWSLSTFAGPVARGRVIRR
jgi:hypothetical protein